MERMKKFSPQLKKIIAMSATFVIAMPFAWAADFPETGSTITVIVPFGPGGMVDLMARTMAPYWDAKWGTRTVVLNRPGANGQIALTEMLRQKPDGQTIAFTQGFDTQMSYLNAEAKAPYSRSSFTPVGRVQSTPSVWVVRADSPYPTMGSLLDAARNRPGELNFGTPASRGPAVLYLEELERKAGAQLTSVPFNDAPSLVSALLGGHIDLATSNPAVVLPHVRAGRLRALMVSGDTPLKYFPDTPTSASLGLEISKLGSNTGLTLARGTPEAAVQAWSTMLEALTSDPALRARMDEMAVHLSYSTPGDYARSWTATEAEVRKILLRVSGDVRPVQ